MQWNSEWSLFVATWFASALTALAPVLLSNKPCTARLLIGTIVLYGGLGAGFGMTVAFDYLGGKTQPWRVLVCGMLVGAGALKKADITVLLRRMLGITDDHDKRTKSHHDSADHS
jgi:hypothetical protein